MSCGYMLQPNPYDSVQVEVSLRMDLSKPDSKDVSDMFAGIEAGLLENFVTGQPQALVGESIPVDPLGGQSPAQLSADGEGNPVGTFTFRFSAEKPLPSKQALVGFGIALVADSGRQRGFVEAEGEVKGVFSEEQCENRALQSLHGSLVSAFNAYAAEAEEKSELLKLGGEGTVPPSALCSMRGLNHHGEEALGRKSGKGAGQDLRALHASHGPLDLGERWPPESSGACCS
jgi:hypothetical protein